MDISSRKIVFFAYIPEDATWINPILGRLQRSSNEKIQERLKKYGETKLSELGLSLSTKLQMILEIVGRVENIGIELSDVLDKRQEDVVKCLDEGCVFSFQDRNFPYALLIELDAFIFETCSCYEILWGFLKKFFNYFLGKKLEKKDLRRMLEDEGIDTRWIDVMTETRNVFIHRSAPWFAVDVKSVSPLRSELIILKKTGASSLKKSDYIEFQDYRDIFFGFKKSLELIQRLVIKEIDNFENENK